MAEDSRAAASVRFAGTAPDAEEAVAVTAAVERFLADTAPAPAEPEPAVPPWQRAALLEGVTAKRAVFPPEAGSGLPFV